MKILVPYVSIKKSEDIDTMFNSGPLGETGGGSSHSVFFISVNICGFLFVMAILFIQGMSRDIHLK